MHQCNWRGVVSDHIYRIPALPTHGTGPDVFGCLCRGTGSLFYCCALDMPFNDKASRLVDSKGPPRPWGRVQFVGILGPAFRLLILLLFDVLLCADNRVRFKFHRCDVRTGTMVRTTYQILYQ